MASSDDHLPYHEPLCLMCSCMLEQVKKPLEIAVQIF